MTHVCRSRIAGASGASDGPRSENRNPSDLSELVSVAVASGQEDVDRAVEEAVAMQPRWAALSPQARSDVLDRAGGLILAASISIGELLAREEGKTRAEAIAETVRAGQVFKYFAGEAMRLTGERFDSTRPGVDVAVTREPVGVIGAITPWNFPIAIPAWKAAPALAFGNAVVMKPSSLTPATADMLADILTEAGLMPGVFALLQGEGPLGAAIIDHPNISAISFTGSVATGGRIIEACAHRRIRVQAEMGGKNPLVVLADADLEVAVECALNGAFYSTGQRCTASERLIVEDGIHDAFVSALTARMLKLRVGHAMDSDSQIGPVVSRAQLERNLGYVELARAEGLDVIGGARVSSRTDGWYQQPALFVGATNAMRTSREEIFGPVASVIRVADYDEALTVANDTVFGLSAGICTNSLAKARHFQRHAEAGMVMVNLPTAGVDPHAPFGGRKGSSFGAREQGAYAREFYTQIKTSYVG